MFQAKNDNERAVLDFFNAVSSGDIERLRPFFTPEFVWKPMFTGAGVKEERGDAVIDEFFAPVLQLFKPGTLKLQVDLVLSDGDVVICELTNMGELNDGRAYNNHYCWVITLEDGKMIGVREYLDSHYIAQLQQPS